MYSILRPIKLQMIKESRIGLGNPSSPSYVLARKPSPVSTRNAPRL